MFFLSVVLRTNLLIRPEVKYRGPIERLSLGQGKDLHSRHGFLRIRGVRGNDPFRPFNPVVWNDTLSAEHAFPIVTEVAFGIDVSVQSDWPHAQFIAEL